LLLLALLICFNDVHAAPCTAGKLCDSCRTSAELVALQCDTWCLLASHRLPNLLLSNQTHSVSSAQAKHHLARDGPIAYSAVVMLAGESRFVLTSVSGGQHCASTELAVAWPSINIKQQADCNYTFSGLKHRYEFPVTFAQVDYPTRSGTRRPYVALQDTMMDPSSRTAGSNSYDTNLKTSSGWQQATLYQNDSLSGFLASWAYIGLPGLSTGPFGPTTNVPGNYTASPAGPSSFNLVGKDTGCTFTYRIVSGSFAGLKPTPCKPGSSSDCPASGSCAPGEYQQQQQGAASLTYICGMCPAGTFSSSSSSKECVPCSAGTAASAVGSTSCQTCNAPLVSSYYSRTACVPVCDKQEGYNLPTFGQNVIYKNGQACDVAVCPNGTVASPNNECLAAQNGNLCVAVSVTGSTTCKAKAESSMSKDAKTEGWGGAVLQLDSADTSAAVCSTGVKQLAAWLGSRQTWLGFNFTQVRFRSASCGCSQQLVCSCSAVQCVHLRAGTAVVGQKAHVQLLGC
jgi:hypothetical protein